MDASIGVNLRVTAHSNQGGRKYMEDMFCVAYQPTSDEKDLLYAYFGIFDGHGGREAALYAKTHLMDHIVSQKNFWSDEDDLVLKAIKDGFISVHHAMWRELDKWPKTPSGLPSTSGTTATVAFVRRGKLYIGHVGDSCIVLGYQDPQSTYWKAKPLTQDHKPESPDEYSRINECGGKVISKSGVPRVVWNRPKIGHKGPVRRSTLIDEIPFLAVARSLGDLWSYNSEMNEFVVSPVPDTAVIDIDVNAHRCLILGSDGLWNMLLPQDAVNSVYFAEKNNERQHQISAAEGTSTSGAPKNWINPSKRLVDRALDRWYSNSLRADNTSVVTVVIDPPGPPKAQRHGTSRTPSSSMPSPERSVSPTNSECIQMGRPSGSPNRESQRVGSKYPEDRASKIYIPIPRPPGSTLFSHTDYDVSATHPGKSSSRSSGNTSAKEKEDKGRQQSQSGSKYPEDRSSRVYVPIPSRPHGSPLFSSMEYNSCATYPGKSSTRSSPSNSGKEKEEKGRQQTQPVRRKVTAAMTARRHGQQLQMQRNDSTPSTDAVQINEISSSSESNKTRGAETPETTSESRTRSKQRFSLGDTPTQQTRKRPSRQSDSGGNKDGSSHPRKIMRMANPAGPSSEAVLREPGLLVRLQHSGVRRVHPSKAQRGDGLNLIKAKATETKENGKKLLQKGGKTRHTRSSGVTSPSAAETSPLPVTEPHDMSDANNKPTHNNLPSPSRLFPYSLPKFTKMQAQVVSRLHQPQMVELRNPVVVPKTRGRPKKLTKSADNSQKHSVGVAILRKENLRVLLNVLPTKVPPKKSHHDLKRLHGKQSSNTYKKQVTDVKKDIKRSPRGPRSEQTTKTKSGPEDGKGVERSLRSATQSSLRVTRSMKK